MKTRVQGLGEEFEGARLGDARRSARLIQIAGALERDSSSGFPRALESAAELEGFYRFINNDGFEASEVFEPHRQATVQRAREAKEVVIVHDTTAVEYRNEDTREGLGYTTAVGRQGFMAHAALVMGPGNVPLGLAHLATYTRRGPGRQKRPKRPVGAWEREPERWLRGVDASEPGDGGYRAIHVMDAEADFFELLRHLNRC